MLGRHGTNEEPDQLGPRSCGSSQDTVTRAPYDPPQLRHLGSVRKLTLAATGPLPDFNNGRHHH